jgi:hypothetical protein
MGKRVWVRFTLVPGCTDDPANVVGIAKFVAPMRNVEWVEVQPLHQLGAFKWKALNLKYEHAQTTIPHPGLINRVPNFDQRAATSAECNGWLPVAAIGPHGNRPLPLSPFELFDKGREFVHIRKNKLGPGGHKAIFVALIAMATANKPEHAHAGGAPSSHARNSVFDHQAVLRSMSQLLRRMQKESRKWLSSKDHFGGVDVRGKLLVESHNPEQIIEQISTGPGGEATRLGVILFKTSRIPATGLSRSAKTSFFRRSIRMAISGGMARPLSCERMRWTSASPTPENRSASSFGVTVMPTERKASDSTSVCKCMESTTTPSQSKISSMIRLSEEERVG